MVKFLKIDILQAMESLLYGSLQIVKISCSGVITFFVLKENLGEGIRSFKLSGCISLLQIVKGTFLLILLLWIQVLGIFFLLNGQDRLFEAKTLSPSATIQTQPTSEPKGIHSWQRSERSSLISNQKQILKIKR